MPKPPKKLGPHSKDRKSSPTSALAYHVINALKRKHRKPPKIGILCELFETMYQSSIAREEGQFVRYQVVYLDPNSPDPNPPRRIVRDRWSFIRFKQPLEMSLGEMRKIGPASDPRSSFFVIYPKQHNRLYVWGLVDQRNRYQDFLNHEKHSGPERLGLFEARIIDPGHLLVSIDYERVAELRVDLLKGETLNVFGTGPIYEVLSNGVSTLLKYVTKHTNAKMTELRVDSITGLWMDTLSRVLLRIQGFGHGGAILLSASGKSNLNLKYKIHYSRLRTALERYATSYCKTGDAWQEISRVRISKAPHLDWKLYFDEVVNKIDADESESELESCIWFISLLSRVDGLVSLTPSLEVRGFGGEITSKVVPPKIELCLSAKAQKNKRKAQSYESLGTRHRSMMRYCYEVPGSVGFVVSQDGDVRVMLRQKDCLLLWDNIRLQTEIKRVDLPPRTEKKTNK